MYKDYEAMSYRPENCVCLSQRECIVLSVLVRLVPLEGAV